MLKKLQDTGDTIIEVLICMAVVSFSLSTSYALSRLSLRKVRDAEERAQSTQLAQTQIERLKAFLAKYPMVKTSGGSNPWILNPTPLPPGMTWTSQGGFVPPGVGGFCLYKSTSALHYTFNTTDPQCAVNKDGHFYCDDAAVSALPDCVSGGYPVLGVDSNTIDGLGYIYRAGVAYTPMASGWLPPDVSLKDDEFYATAGRYQIGGDGVNLFKFSVVSIPYRIHQ